MKWARLPEQHFTPQCKEMKEQVKNKIIKITESIPWGSSTARTTSEQKEEQFLSHISKKPKKHQWWCQRHLGKYSNKTKVHFLGHFREIPHHADNQTCWFAVCCWFAASGTEWLALNGYEKKMNWRFFKRPSQSWDLIWIDMLWCDEALNGSFMHENTPVWLIKGTDPDWRIFVKLHLNKPQNNSLSMWKWCFYHHSVLLMLVCFSFSYL